MICVSLRVNFVLKSTTLLLLCSYHVLKWELFILDSIILFLCFARSKFCSKISRFSMGIALTLARTARLTLYGTFFTIYCGCTFYFQKNIDRLFSCLICCCEKSIYCGLNRDGLCMISISVCIYDYETWITMPIVAVVVVIVKSM